MGRERGKKRGGEGEKGDAEKWEKGERRGREGRECATPIFTGAPPHFLILGVAPVGSSPDRYARGSANRLKAVIASTTQLGSPRQHTPCCLIRGMFCTNYYLLKRILDIASGHVPITLLCLSLIII